MHILYNIIYITVDSVQRVRYANIVLSRELITKKINKSFSKNKKKEKKTLAIFRRRRSIVNNKWKSGV